MQISANNEKKQEQLKSFTKSKLETTKRREHDDRKASLRRQNSATKQCLTSLQWVNAKWA